MDDHHISPPEILLIAYTESGRIKYMQKGATEFPKFWSYKYEMEDVPKALHSLEKRGFIFHDAVGQFHPTEKGKKVLKDNEHIPYIHHHPNIEDLNILNVNDKFDEIELPFKSSWRDKLWAYLNKRSLEHQSNSDWGLYRNTRYTMALYRADEGSYKDAVRFIDEVIALDKRSGLFREFAHGTPDGVLKQREVWRKKLR